MTKLVSDAMRRAGAFAAAAYGFPNLYHPDGEVLEEIWLAMEAARDQARPVDKETISLNEMRETVVEKLRSRATIYRASGHGINYNEEDAAVDEIAAEAIYRSMHQARPVDEMIERVAKWAFFMKYGTNIDAPRWISIGYEAQQKWKSAALEAVRNG